MSKWPLRSQHHGTNSHVQQSPSAQATAYFEAPYITLRTGNRAAETTDVKPRKAPSHSLHFFVPPQWAFYRRFAASSVVLHISTSFSLLLLPALESPSFSSAFCSLYYFWPFGRGYSRGDTDKAIRTLNEGCAVLVRVSLHVHSKEPSPSARATVITLKKNWRKTLKCFLIVRNQDISVCRSACRNVTTWRATEVIFMKFNVWGFFSLKKIENFQFSSKSER